MNCQSKQERSVALAFDMLCKIRKFCCAIARGKCGLSCKFRKIFYTAVTGKSVDIVKVVATSFPTRIATDANTANIAKVAQHMPKFDFEFGMHCDTNSSKQRQLRHSCCIDNRNYTVHAKLKTDFGESSSLELAFGIVVCDTLLNIKTFETEMHS